MASRDQEREEVIQVTSIEGQCFTARLLKFPPELFREIDQKISQTISTQAKPVLTSFTPGDLVAVCIENIYLRAVVLQIFKPYSILVELLDIGSREIVHLYEIRHLDKSFNVYPLMATHILLKRDSTVAVGQVRTLKNIELWQVCGKDHFYGNVEQSFSDQDWKKTMMEVRAVQPGSLPPCSRYFSKFPPPQEEVLDDLTLQTERSLSLLDAPEENYGKQRENQDETDKFTSTQLHSSITASEPDLTIEEASKSVTNLSKANIPPVLTIGIHRIKVILLQDCGQVVTVCRAGSEEKVKMLEDKIQSFACKFRRITSLQVGDFVLAILHENGKTRLLRALVNEIDSDLIQVEYVDHAVFDLVTMENLRELPTCFAQQAAHAASLCLDAEVDAGRHYSVVIDMNADSFERVFSAHILEQFPFEIEKLETGIVFFRAAEALTKEEIFGIQRKWENVAAVETELCRIYNGGTLVPKTTFEIGDRVMTIYEGIYCRAIITATGSYGVTLIYVDYGTRDEVPFDNVFDVQAGEYLRFPTLSFQCVLTNPTEAELGKVCDFEIHEEVECLAGVPVYRATIVKGD